MGQVRVAGIEEAENVGLFDRLNGQTQVFPGAYTELFAQFVGELIAAPIFEFQWFQIGFWSIHV